MNRRSHQKVPAQNEEKMPIGVISPDDPAPIVPVTRDGNGGPAHERCRINDLSIWEDELVNQENRLRLGWLFLWNYLSRRGAS